MDTPGKDALTSITQQTPRSYVRVDEHGVLRVSNSRVMLDSVVAGFEQGHSAETIQQQYPDVSLEEVYGAIAWCLAHRDELALYRKRQQAVWEHWRSEAAKSPSPVLQRLRTLQKARESGSS